MIVKVFVKTGSSKGPLVVPEGDGVTVYLREKPHDGEANEALTRVLARHFGVSKSQVAVRRGARSHRKEVEIIE